MRSQPSSQTPSPTPIAIARERFLTGDSIDSGVRENISTSWRRSRDFNVHADRLELPFIREPNLESPLIAAARPVIHQLADDLSAEPVSIILTSSDGVVLSRATASHALEDRLDDVRLAPGFSYSEEYAGTNGIGTALETRQPTLVRGSEHYAGCFASLSCAGVPIVHPVSGSMVGALDLTGWVGDSGPLLLSLAKSATAQIEQRMLSQASERESRLLNAYLSTCRRAPQMMVLALAGDVVLMNQRLRLAVDPQDQVALLEHAVDQTMDGSSTRRVSTLPSGHVVRLSPVSEYWDDKAGMAVFFVHLLHAEKPAPTPADSRLQNASLPGVVGRSSSWRQCCDRVVRYTEAGQWIALSGESGCGRSSLLRAAAQHARGSTRVFSARDFERHEETMDALAGELDREDFSIILKDVDQFDEAIQTEVAGLLQGLEDSGWVGMTISDGNPDTASGAILLPFFTHTVPIPPLRHRIEDLHDLIPTLLRQLTRGRELAVSAEAMRHLSKYSWPGNVAELRQILREVVMHQRSGIIDVHQLPPACRSLSRHTLTRIEALERDAIVRSLEENGNSKAAAAQALGISRATIYRKIKEFGIHL
ncbi:helix-turn-helix domain-containing protein [Gordonia sp. CPCC 205515]|uniref:sigma-54-dependent Fis family transcriptional regulator n=1 Tax=Gordonia sp. CPCC 205515 TaxID=3140791 RepID=UPI003AF38B9C